MMNKFKKLGTAAAVAAAMGAPAVSQAITLSNAAPAVLVPYAVYDSSTAQNTLVALNVLENGSSSAESANIHWVFFNARSGHEIDDTLPATDGDIVPFDWAAELAALAAQTVYDGVPGYLVFMDDKVYTDGTGTTSTLSMYGDAAIINGSWSAASYIPVLPLPSGSVGVGGDVLSATQGANLGENFAMRYNVQPALGGQTDFVIWTHDNPNKGSISNEVTVYVYDTDENDNSAKVVIDDELNVIDAASIVGVTAKQAGFVLFAGTGSKTGGTSQGISGSDFDDFTGSPQGVAFSLIYVNSAGDAQTTLAHEGYTF